MNAVKPCAFNRSFNTQYTAAATDAFSNMPLAMAYVPWQTWQNVYDGAAGLKNGSIFEELVMPFLCANPACQECSNGSSMGMSKGNTHSFVDMNQNMNYGGRRGFYR